MSELPRFPPLDADGNCVGCYRTPKRCTCMHVVGGSFVGNLVNESKRDSYNPKPKVRAAIIIVAAALIGGFFIYMAFQAAA